MILAVREPARDDKPFRRPAVKARIELRRQVARGLALGHAKPKPKEVSVLPPSRVRGHDLKPTHVKKPPQVKKPAPHVKKPPPVNNGHDGTHGNRGPAGRPASTASPAAGGSDETLTRPRAALLAPRLRSAVAPIASAIGTPCVLA